MADLPIDDSLLTEMKKIAEREGRTTTEIAEIAIRDFIAFYQQQDEPQTSETRDPFMLIAQAADELGIGSKEGDIAQRSREILNKEFPAYLKRRQASQNNE